MADDKQKTGPEAPSPEQPGEVPAGKSPPEPEAPVPEKAAEAAEHGAGPTSQPEQSVLPGMGGDAPPASGEVIVDFDKINDLMAQRRSAARAESEKAEQASKPEKKSPESEHAPKRWGRSPKEQDSPQVGKAEKGPEPRTVRPVKADKAARGKSPSPALDKVSRGGKKDKDRETGSEGVGSDVKSPKGKLAPIKEAEAPAPEIKLPPAPEVPPRPVEQGKIVYLKLSEPHPFHTLRDHPFKVQDDKAMDNLVGTIKEHGIMTPATVRLERTARAMRSSWATAASLVVRLPAWMKCPVSSGR